ncbi:MAG TPA: MBL fold metallo-hydrolase [Geminicoccaceae bacterium]|nr:MBL fold metallo-hydrolase [Geminicoccaceae bacterium]
MKLTFLGTRGNIDACSPIHRRHTALLVSYHGRDVMIDCGSDWRGRLDEIAPRAVVVTHAHPDHALGLKDGTRCPVLATAEAWQEMAAWPIAHRRVVQPRRPVAIEGITFEAFPVEHSLHAPAVGYRVRAGRVGIFYGPDVVFIREREAALSGLRLFIGDGATLTRPLIRRRGEHLISHTPVRTQLTWCGEAGIRRAIITHCGSEIVTTDAAGIAAQVSAMGEQRGVEASVAHDGMTLVLR